MEYCYKGSDLLTVLQEALFWKRQEYEHTLFIEETVKGLEVDYMNTLIDFRDEFRRAESNITRSIESIIRNKYCISYEYLSNILYPLTKNIILQSGRFIYFLNNVMENSQVVKSNLMSQTIINHIIKESQYFYGVATSNLPHDFLRY